MTFEEALDALLREYNKDDWEVTIRTLFKAIAAVEAHVWGPHPEPAERVVEPAPALPVPEDTVSQFVADPVHEEPVDAEYGEPVNIHVVPRVSEPQPDFDAMQRIIEHKVF